MTERLKREEMGIRIRIEDRKVGDSRDSKKTKV
jgi:hypothetical protein